MKRVFISQPMAGKSKETILSEREEAIQEIRGIIGDNFRVIESYQEDYDPSIGNPLTLLSRALELLVDADIVYFAKGWQEARGCRIENTCAYEYGITAIHHSREDDNVKHIKIKYFYDDIEKIEKIEQGDWIDLRIAEDTELKAGEFKIIPLGVGMILPDGYEAHIVPRSSTYKKFGVIQTNHMGVIDQSYCGENDMWRFPAYALRDTVLHKNDRICQFRIVKKQEEIEFEEVEKLNDVSRGGFGSTGVK